MSEKYTIDMTPFVKAMNNIVESFKQMAEAAASLAQPRPQVEVRELRDLCREYNLDHVERGEATVTRVGGQLIAKWNDEEVTRFTEYANE